MSELGITKLWKHIEGYWKLPTFAVLIVAHNNTYFINN